MDIVFAEPTNVEKEITLKLTSAQAEEILVALALRRKQLGASGYDVKELFQTLDKAFTKTFGWDAFDRTYAYFKEITKVILRK